MSRPSDGALRVGRTCVFIGDCGRVEASSLLSGLILYNSFPAATDLVEDDVGGGFPDERSWLVVPVGQPLIDARSSSSAHWKVPRRITWV